MRTMNAWKWNGIISVREAFATNISYKGFWRQDFVLLGYSAWRSNLWQSPSLSFSHVLEIGKRRSIALCPKVEIRFYRRPIFRRNLSELEERQFFSSGYQYHQPCLHSWGGLASIVQCGFRQRMVLFQWLLFHWLCSQAWLIHFCLSAVPSEGHCFRVAGITGRSSHWG